MSCRPLICLVTWTLCNAFNIYYVYMLFKPVYTKEINGHIDTQKEIKQLLMNHSSNNTNNLLFINVNISLSKNNNNNTNKAPYRRKRHSNDDLDFDYITGVRKTKKHKKKHHDDDDLSYNIINFDDVSDVNYKNKKHTHKPKQKVLSQKDAQSVLSEGDGEDESGGEKESPKKKFKSIKKASKKFNSFTFSITKMAIMITAAILVVFLICAIFFCCILSMRLNKVQTSYKNKLAKGEAIKKAPPSLANSCAWACQAMFCCGKCEKDPYGNPYSQMSLNSRSSLVPAGDNKERRHSKTISTNNSFLKPDIKPDNKGDKQNIFLPVNLVKTHKSLTDIPAGIVKSSLENVKSFHKSNTNVSHCDKNENSKYLKTSKGLRKYLVRGQSKQKLGAIDYIDSKSEDEESTDESTSETSILIRNPKNIKKHIRKHKNNSKYKNTHHKSKYRLGDSSMEMYELDSGSKRKHQDRKSRSKTRKDHKPPSPTLTDVLARKLENRNSSPSSEDSVYRYTKHHKRHSASKYYENKSNHTPHSVSIDLDEGQNRTQNNHYPPACVYFQDPRQHRDIELPRNAIYPSATNHNMPNNQGCFPYPNSNDFQNYRVFQQNQSVPNQLYTPLPLDPVIGKYPSFFPPPDQFSNNK